MQNGDFVPLRAGIDLFERSEFVIATSPPPKLCVCSTNLGFSVGYVLCTRYVCTTLYDTRYGLCTRYVCYQVRIMYQIRMYHTCRCTINTNSTAVSLFVYSLVGGGITRTFRPWTHTSDDSYIYQLSPVVATATVSLFYYCRRCYSMTT